MSEQAKATVQAQPKTNASTSSKGSSLQRAAVNAAPVNDVPRIVHDVLAAPGQPLDPDTREFMESRFKHDFSNVRVHTDAKAAESTRSVNALAYTVGSNVVFGAGQYQPETSAGKRLLAHELTHVVQQGLETEDHLLASEPAIRLSRESDAGEVEAHRVSNDILMDQPTNITSLSESGSHLIMRQTPPGTPGVSFREARATAGETEMAFRGYRAEEGWAFIDGPSGSAGHRWNAPGADGVAFRTKGTFEIHILDNKSYARPGAVSSSTALTTNLADYLDKLNAKIATSQYDNVSRIQQVRSSLQATRAALNNPNQKIPSNVKLIVTGAGGRSTGVTQALRNKGVEFRDVSAPSSRGTPSQGGPGSSGPTSTEGQETSKPTSPAAKPGEPESATSRPRPGRVSGEPEPTTPRPRPTAPSGGSEPAVPRSRPGRVSGEPEPTTPRPRIGTGSAEPGSSGLRISLRGAPSPVTRTAVNMAANLVRGLLTGWMHDMMLKSLQETPRPSLEKKEGKAFFQAIKRSEKLTVLNLISTDIPQFAKDFDQEVIDFGWHISSAAIGNDGLKDKAEREKGLKALISEILQHQSNLTTIQHNINQALALEPTFKERMKAAQSLREILESGPAVYGMFELGMSVEEISALSSNLAHYVALHEVTLNALHQLDAAVRKADAIDTNFLKMLNQAFNTGGYVSGISSTKAQ